MPNVFRRRESRNSGTALFHIICFLLLFCWPLSTARAATPEPMLPEVYHGQVDVRGWLMSEKLDGVRGYWDGKRLWSKDGKAFRPPAAFVHGLPDFPLEGEIWGGRCRYEQTVATVLKERPDDGWLKLKFAVFDVPEAAVGFSRRIEKARVWFADHPSDFAFVIEQRPVRNRHQLEQELRRVEKLGGEGLMVRRPDALYVAGRSTDILKVKDFQDAEAVVVGHISGKGRNSGVLGSLLVERPDNTRFKIGTGFSDEERRNPPPVGTVITFKYYGTFSSGIPRFPSFLRIRKDHGL
jgi:DNA ligase-1